MVSGVSSLSGLAVGLVWMGDGFQAYRLLRFVALGLRGLGLPRPSKILYLSNIP